MEIRNMSYLPEPKQLPNIWKLRCCLKEIKKLSIGKIDPQPYHEYHILCENGEFYKTYVVTTYRNYKFWSYLEPGDVFYNCILKYDNKRKKIIIDADSKTMFIQHATFDKFYKKYVKKDPNLNQTNLFEGDKDEPSK
jgi:hypothetical protein